MGLERRRILYTGQVQGVGFRWSAMSALRNLSVTGYVANLPDGQVELVIEGTALDNDEAAQRIRNAMGRHIRGESHETSLATGEFREFAIRR